MKICRDFFILCEENARARQAESDSSLSVKDNVDEIIYKYGIPDILSLFVVFGSYFFYRKIFLAFKYDFAALSPQLYTATFLSFFPLFKVRINIQVRPENSSHLRHHLA